MRSTVEYPIDFVITWVDGSDPAWLDEKARYTGEGARAIADDPAASDFTASDDRDIRFRDWDLLRYWFRGVERFTPWVRTVHFVTWGHLPGWLDTGHPRLHVVNHRDFIPEKYLPTFSSHAIEWNMHRIPDLAEHFVYFNDDMFLLKETGPEVFFKDGLPCGAAIHSPSSVLKDDWFFVPVTDAALLSKHFSPRACIKAHPGKWLNPCYGADVLRTVLLLPYPKFYGMLEDHLPHSFLKSSFDAVWAAEPEFIDATCHHRFRSNTDVNQWLVEWWQYCEGTFMPRSPKVGKCFGSTGAAGQGIGDAVAYITQQKGHVACVNDSALINDFDDSGDRLAAAFESILPERSSFEREGA